MIYLEKFQKSEINFVAGATLVCLAVYAASFLGFLFTPLNYALFLCLLILALFLSINKPEAALLMAFFELMLSSKGYLFSLEFFGTEVSLRMGMFLIIISVWLGRWIFGKREGFSVLKYIPLMLLVVLGIARGLGRGNNFDNVFYDANGFFFLGYLGPAAEMVKSERINKIILSLASGLAALWSVTMFLTIGFSTGFFNLESSIYKWVRATGLGEITVVNETFARVFFQSHIFALAGFFLFSSMVIGIKEKTKNIFYLAFSVLSAGVLITDLSRSYWMGAAAGLMALCWIYAKNKTVTKQKLLLPFLAIIAALVISAVLLPALPSVISGRGGSLSDPAASSRRAMLRPLWEGIKKTPIVGSGFGTVLTYQTQDPRALERNPKGVITTFAFEWGWLDMWLKMGLLGILAYLWLIFCVLKRLYKASEENKPLAYGLFAAMVALAITHTFSPYLNHPLGIGLLLLADAVAENA